MAEIAAGPAKGRRIEIWYQDEARIGQKNKITRRWAKRGSRPSAPHDQSTRSTSIFGAICPRDGKAAALVVPGNITILPMRPKSPELNPVENIWLFMRDNWLSNRVLKSYEDIVDYCCYAWRTLQERPWRIMSIGRRQWAQGF